MNNENNGNEKLAIAGNARAKPARWGWTQNEEGELTFQVEMTTHRGESVVFYGSASLNTDTPTGMAAWDVTEKAIATMGGDASDPERIELDRNRVVNIEIEHRRSERDGRVRAVARSVWASALDTRAAKPESLKQFAAMLSAHREDRAARNASPTRAGQSTRERTG